MKIDKDLKKEIDHEISSVTYTARKIIIRIVIVIILISAVSAISAFGYRIWKTNTDRIAFKSSLTYNEGMIDDLAKYRFEMQTTEDEVEKSAIARLVNDRFANFDESKIEDSELRDFLEDCRNGKY